MTPLDAGPVSGSYEVFDSLELTDPVARGSFTTDEDRDYTVKVDATAKHYVVHSGPEATRHFFDVHPSEQDLFETYLPAFRALVQEAHVDAVMGAYNRVNGESASASPRLLTDLLRTY